MTKYLAVMTDFKVVVIELFETSLAYNLLPGHFDSNLLDDGGIIICRFVIRKIFIHHL
jgi:hypothetical protein